MLQFITLRVHFYSVSLKCNAVFHKKKHKSDTTPFIDMGWEHTMITSNTLLALRL